MGRKLVFGRIGGSLLHPHIRYIHLRWYSTLLQWLVILLMMKENGGKRINSFGGAQQKDKEDKLIWRSTTKGFFR
jgi:hypothetical protein